MNRTSKQAIITIFIGSAFIIGLIVLLVSITNHSGQWVTHKTNRHIYASGRINNMGSILDRKDNILVQTKNNKRVYSSDSTTRKATLHVVGDLDGFIATGVQKLYSDKLIGYDFVNGLYHTGENVGNNIYLTIDSSVSAAALKSLGDRKGAVAAYNYKTGEIICLVSSPTYDPNKKPDIENNLDKYEGVYLNRCISSSYTPGSIFKIVTASAAIENIDDLDERIFNCKGEYKTADGKVKCNGKHGKINFEEAFKESCNSAFAEMSIELGAKTLTRQADKIGFGANFRFDEFKLAKSIINLNNTTETDLGWAGIGQYTDLVNPCHMMIMCGAIANGGSPVIPHMVNTSSLSTAYGNKRITPNMGDAMFSESTADKLDKMMRNNVANKYGEKRFAGLKVCAKTGTAQIQEEVEDHSWFIGYVQDEKYPIAFAVIVENGGFGVNAALPVAGDTLTAIKKAL